MTHALADAVLEDSFAREALPVMFKQKIGSRDAAGAVHVEAHEDATTLLYGPYWRLAEGLWRLRISCLVRGEAHPEAACLGVEVIAGNRFLCVSRDFSAQDCRAGDLLVAFRVSPELSEAELKAMFEFRLLHLGRANLTIRRVAIERDPPGADAPSLSRWRLSPRLRPTVLARQTADGATRARAGLTRGELIRRLKPVLHLPAGLFLLTIRCEAPARAGLGAPFASITLTAGGSQLLRADLAASDLDATGLCRLAFRIPPEAGFEAGGEVDVQLSVKQTGKGRFTLRSIDVLPAPPDAPAQAPSRPAILTGSSRIVIVGNCQAELLCQGYRKAFSLSKFEPRYHFVRLNPLLHDQGRRDLENCDLLLVQKISDFEDYPLRGEIKPGVDIHYFPCLRLASPWPFDGYNGPTDQLALQSEGEDLAFPYLDGRLAQLRDEFPDPEARLRAYCTLDATLERRVAKLARYEERRLAAMDREFGFDLGAFINEEFRRSRIFHTTNHPSGALFSRLMTWIARRAGHRLLWAPRRPLDQLGNIQVPIHPEVARILQIKWAGPGALYEARGAKIAWDDYVRAYIRHYG